MKIEVDESRYSECGNIKRKNDEIFSFSKVNVYCEKVFRLHGEQRDSFIFDFQDDSSVNQLKRILGIDSKVESSMIFVKNIMLKKRKGFESGSWYSLPINFFTTNFEFILIEDDDAFFGEFNYLGEDEIDVSSFLIRIPDMLIDSVGFDNEELIQKEESLFSLEVCKLNIVVKNVGVGNWNEIRYGDRVIAVYDFGVGSPLSSKSSVSRIINSSNIIQSSSKFIGFISHFDLDHYKGLLNKNFPLSNILVLYFPDNIPQTNTLKKLFSKLQKNGIPLKKIARPAKQSRNVSLHRIGILGCLDIYCSDSLAKSRNNSGLVLVINGAVKVGFLTGDHSYHTLEQLVSLYQKQKVFVLPHHLGRAGNFNSGHWSALLKKNDITIASTRSGIYRNLPINSRHDFFQLHTNFKCTECLNSDIVEYL
ncbi:MULTISPECIES: hypothetical protein [Streptococcus]|uniref:Metallo-beta-lactamase domain-containing protein n=1 Tax=Streptococcus caledonicus TaxID=2614158 RepID=A0ABW0UBD3_9STRE|nr:hypothetical protein [Streptococcus sp. S784/96/1]